MNKAELEEKVAALEAENTQLREGADATILAENAALKAEKEQLTEALGDAHVEIAEAEEKSPEAPVFTASILDDEGKKTKKTAKVKLIVPKAQYPVGRNEMVEVTAKTLKENQDLVDTLYSIGFGGFEEVNPED